MYIFWNMTHIWFPWTLPVLTLDFAQRLRGERDGNKEEEEEKEEWILIQFQNFLSTPFPHPPLTIPISEQGFQEKKLELSQY